MATSIEYDTDNRETDPLLVNPGRWTPDISNGGDRSRHHTGGYERRRQTARDEQFISGDHGTFLGVKNSLSSEYEHIIAQMDNPVSVALDMCQRHVLRPYMRLLQMVGWHPIFDSAATCWEKAVNIVYPTFVILLIFVGYIIEFAACFRRDVQGEMEDFIPLEPAMNTSGSNSTPSAVVWPKCRTFVISQYIIPDILHSLAFAYSFYLLRISRSEQLPTLMERVFLQTSPTQSGFLSQGKLIRSMRLLLYTGVCWVVLSLAAQIIHVVAQYDDINFAWLAPGTEAGRILLLIMMLISFLALDLVYTVVVINYCVQCSLLIYYQEGLQEKIRQKYLDLRHALKEIAEIESHLKDLNYNTAIALSIVLFNFATMAVLGAAAFLDVNNGFTVLMYVSSGLSVFFWVTILVVPVVQAARLTAGCNSLRKLGHEIRVRPFAYQDTSEQELDTFLIYTSSLNMRAKIFLIPIRTSYVCGLVLIVSFVLLLLFQTGVIEVWL